MKNIIVAYHFYCLPAYSMPIGSKKIAKNKNIVRFLSHVTSAVVISDEHCIKYNKT